MLLLLLRMMMMMKVMMMVVVMMMMKVVVVMVLVVVCREQCSSCGRSRRRAGAAEYVQRLAQVRQSQSSHCAEEVCARGSQERHQPQSVTTDHTHMHTLV